ncbi:MAG: hypothetical protein C5B59_08750 [Bacteroidetes bacterium]|nr:MAG: hypothetical protein C5B59_08750 [Bacteroidota bacterium]
MARLLSSRYDRNFIIGALRKLARDEEVSPWLRLKVIDRLAHIAKVYEASLDPVNPPKVPKPPTEPAPPEEKPAAEPEDIEAEKVLSEYLDKRLTRGRDGISTGS